MRNVDTKVAALRRVDFLRSCTDRELAKLSSTVDRISVEIGRVLMREGDYGREAFVVVTGSAEVTAGDVAIATIGPGGFIGEMAMLSGEPRSATVIAITDIELLVLSPATFRAFAEHPEVGLALSRCLARRLADVQAQL